jgi:ATP-dependent RNA helicase SUPV3L1/SUV3
VGRLVKGPQPFAPRVEPLASELLEPAMRERLRARLEAWLAAHLDRQLPALAAARDADLSGPARGILYQLAEGLGALSRRAVEGLVDGLGPGERKALAGLGVRLGRDSVYLAPLMRPRAVRLRALLWSVHRQVTPPALDPEATVVPAADDAPADFYTACGYRRTGALAIRMDRAEKLAAEARKLARQGPFVATPKLAAAAGCGLSELPALLAGLGFRRREDESGVSFTAGQRARRPQGKRPQGKRPQGKRPKGKRSPHKAPATNPCSPFSVLRDLVPPK